MNGAVAVLGAGSWGTALGHLLARNGHPTTLWARDAGVARAVREEHRNPGYLCGERLDPSLGATHRLAEALEGADVVVGAVPSHAVRETFRAAREHLAEDVLLVGGSKGIETDTGLRMSQVIGQVLGDRGYDFVALSGPSFALELLRGLPTAMAAASGSHRAARSCQRLFQNEHLRVYTLGDVVGTELGGSLKNVIALAAGISDGLELGNNARAALLTRGLAEMVRLAVAMGGDAMTLAGLAGVGDLVLTCTGDLSRNRRAGLAIGSGATREEALREVRHVVEGVYTVRAARELAERYGVEMPIVEAVHAILFRETDPRRALAGLMARDPKPERWS